METKANGNVRLQNEEYQMNLLYLDHVSERHRGKNGDIKRREIDGNQMEREQQTTAHLKGNSRSESFPPKHFDD